MPRLFFSSNGGSGGSDTNDSGHLTLGTRFSVTAAGGKLVGYRFRYAAGVSIPSNVAQFALYDAATQLQVATSLVTGVAVVAGTSADGGWYTIDLPAPINLVQNKEYVATVFMPSNFRSMARPALSGTTQADRGFLHHLGCRFVVSGTAAMVWPSNTSSAYYYIEPIVQVPHQSSFSGVDGDWTFDYGNATELFANGWSFTTPAGVNTSSGTAVYSETGITIDPNSDGTSDVLHRALPADWTSIKVKLVANPAGVAGRNVRMGFRNNTEQMFLGVSHNGIPSDGGNSAYDQTFGAWFMTDRGYNLANLGADIPRWMRIDRDPVTELLTYMFSLNGIDWLIPIHGANASDTELATRVPYNIDANTFFISGASPDAWTFKVQEVAVQGTPEPLPVAEGEMRLPDGRRVVRIYKGEQQMSAGYKQDGTWIFQPTMDGEYVAFDITGPSFRPKIGLFSGSTAQCLWTLSDGKVLADGLNPELDFRVSGERQVRLYVRDGNTPAFEQVEVLNLGYDNTEDPGLYGPGPTHNYPPQPVTEITNLIALSGLRMIMGAHSLLQHVPLTNMSDLEFVEFFHAEVEEVDLTGCDSLIRLCLESCRVGDLDLNPVSDTLRDLRWAVQRGLSSPATIAPLSGTMAQMYHYCIRNNDSLVGNLSFTQLPVIEERWDWECDIPSISGTIPNTLRSYQTYGNPYTSSEVDEIYVGLDAAGRTNGLLFIQAGDQTPAAPGSAGATARANLIAKGWTITS